MPTSAQRCGTGMALIPPLPKSTITPASASAKRRGTGMALTPPLPTSTGRPLSSCVTITPAETTFIERLPSRPHSSSPGNINTILFGGAESMLNDQYIAPRHSHHRMSVLQPLYKRLPPKDIVCFKAGDELIVVIPAITSKTDKGLVIILRHYVNVFQREIQN